MSIGHHLAEYDIENPDNFIAMFTYDEAHMGKVQYLEIKPSDYLLFQGDEKYVIWIGPHRDERTVKDSRIVICTGDNAVGLFKTKEERDTFLKRLVDALYGKISLLVRVVDEDGDLEVQKRFLKPIV